MTTHEDFNRRAEGKGSSDRAFGVVFVVFFLLIGLAPLRNHHPARWTALSIAILLLLVACFRPALLHPFNVIWTRLGIALGRIVSPIITAALFFLVVTPIGLLLRLVGKDPLRLAPDAQATSYWIERRPPGPPPESMANQF